MLIRIYNKTLGLSVATAALLCCAAVSSALAAVPAASGASSAQAAGNAALLEEVVVTARRRSEDVQQVPISIAVFSGEQLAARGIDTTEALNHQVPNVAIASDHFFGRDQGSFHMRGLPDVGIYVDGIAHQETFGLLGSIVEMDRVEILRGPQGTLFGKASMGGAIQYVTKKPADTFGARVKLATGSYNRFDATAIVDLPLSSTFLTKLTVAKLKRDGYLPSVTVRERFGSQDDTIARFDALWKPSEKFSWELAVSREDNRSNGSPTTIWRLDPSCATCITAIYNGIGLTIPQSWVYGAQGVFKTASNYQGPELFTNVRDYSTQLNYALNDHWALKGIASYRTVENVGYEDFDGIPYHTFDGKNYNTVTESTQEAQLLFSGSRVTGTTGLYAYRDDRRFLRNNWFANELHLAVSPTNNAKFKALVGIPAFVPFPGFFVADVNTLTFTYTTGWAAFTEWNIKITDKFSATAGLRYNKDKSVTAGYTPHDTLPDLCCEPFLNVQTDGKPPTSLVQGQFSNTAPRISLQYQWSPEVMSYFTYAEGFNRGGGTQTSAGVIPYSPETLKNYEVGLRSDLFDRRLRFNASLFYSQYNNVQVTQDLNFFNVTTNAGKGTAKGAELEGQWLMSRSFSLNYGFGYLDTAYSGIPVGPSAILNGRVFPYAPKTSYSVGLQYDTPVSTGGSVTLRGDYGWQADVYSNADDSRGLIPAYGLLNARITYHSSDEKWEAALFGTNITNKFYSLNGYVIEPLGLDTRTVGRPAEWGLSFNFKF